MQKERFWKNRIRRFASTILIVVITIILFILSRRYRKKDPIIMSLPSKKYSPSIDKTHKDGGIFHFKWRKEKEHISDVTKTPYGNIYKTGKKKKADGNDLKNFDVDQKYENDKKIFHSQGQKKEMTSQEENHRRSFEENYGLGSRLDFIDREVDRVMQYKTRAEQNRMFKKIDGKDYDLEPIRLTTKTAVFKILIRDRIFVLKRTIQKEKSMFNEDYMTKSIGSHENLLPLEMSVRRNFVSKDKKRSYEVIWLLFKYLDRKITYRGTEFTEDLIRNIAHDVLQGLNHMHKRRIVHMDIKLENVMGTYSLEKRRIVYKLIDYGFSINLKNHGNGNTKFIILPGKSYGTYPHKAPEIINSHKHGFASDVWSLGATCFFMSLGRIPFYKDDKEKDTVRYKEFLRDRIDAASDPSQSFKGLNFSPGTSIELRNFIARCLDGNEETRPPVSLLLKDDFITRGHISV